MMEKTLGGARMRTRKSRYAEMERSFGFILLLDTLLFVFYLIAAANGTTWLKILLFIAVFLISVLCLIILYYAGEIGRQRSLWMVAASSVIAICVLFSLILNFPSPNPYKQNVAGNPVSSTSASSTAADT